MSSNNNKKILIFSSVKQCWSSIGVYQLLFKDRKMKVKNKKMGDKKRVVIMFLLEKNMK